MEPEEGGALSVGLTTSNVGTDWPLFTEPWDGPPTVVTIEEKIFISSNCSFFMGSHYLFFKPEQAVNFIEAMRPRQRLGMQRKPFDFSMRREKEYGDVAFYVMTDGQRQRIQGTARGPGEKNQEPIYTIGDMVKAELVDFTSKNLAPNVCAFRADFFSPVRDAFFAYATPYGSGRFKQQMKKKA